MRSKQLSAGLRNTPITFKTTTFGQGGPFKPLCLSFTPVSHPLCSAAAVYMVLMKASRLHISGLITMLHVDSMTSSEDVCLSSAVLYVPMGGGGLLFAVCLRVHKRREPSTVESHGLATDSVQQMTFP